MAVLHDYYRPRELADVIGQDAVVKSLSGVIKRGGSRTFMFAGPSGVGKTTLAKITARMLGCADRNVLDINAAVNTGIDAMRRVQELTQYRPFGKDKWRGLIIDEAHRLSGQAWDSLLLALEKPPEYVAWFICTTSPAKVPKTIKTRCASFALKPVAESELRKLFARVADAEKIRMDREVRDAVIREAEGSPRQMLSNMEVCADARSRKEASELLRTAQETDGIRELCQFLMRGGSWSKAASILDSLKDEPPESVRIAVCNYIGGALRNARSDRDATHLLGILDEFAQPYGVAERAMLALSVGRVLFSGGE